MVNNIIQLSEDQFIASGAFCRCYRHPQNKNECVKIITENKKAKKRLKADLAYFKKLHKKNTDLQYIANYLDTCSTNLGEGYIFECLTDTDQCVSKTLEYYLTNEDLKKELYLKELHKVGIYLLNNRILISDLHSKNILLQLSEDNPPKPVIVDGLGDTVAITIQNISKSHVQSKIIRRWNRFVRRVVKRHPDHEDLLHTITLSKNHIKNNV